MLRDAADIQGGVMPIKATGTANKVWWVMPVEAPDMFTKGL